MTTSTSAMPHVARWRLLLTGGLVVLAGCVALYASGASRAVATWLLPLGAAATAVGWAGAMGRRVARWALLALAVMACALAILGAVTLAYSLAHQPTPA